MCAHYFIPESSETKYIHVSNENRVFNFERLPYFTSGMENSFFSLGRNLQNETQEFHRKPKFLGVIQIAAHIK